MLKVVNAHVVSLWILLIVGACSDESRRPLKALTNEQLVDGLASTNPKPTNTHKGRVLRSLPSGYKSDRQLPVKQCFDELVARGREAFPALLDHLHDERYSCLQGRTDECYPTSVGDVCWFLVYSQVRPWPARLYGPKHRPLLQPGVPFVVPGYDDATAWYEKHKNDTLAEMQRSAFQTTLDFVMNSDSFSNGESARTNYQGGLQWCLRYLEETTEPITICATWYVGSGRLGQPRGEPILFYIASPRIKIDDDIKVRVGAPPFNIDDCPQTNGPRR